MSKMISHNRLGDDWGGNCSEKGRSQLEDTCPVIASVMKSSHNVGKINSRYLFD